MDLAQRRALLARFGRDFLGVLPPSDPGRRTYLDAAATSLMPKAVFEAQRAYYERACANPHTDAHMPGRATTEAIEQARAAVGALVGYDPSVDEVVFLGSGSTAALNRLARALFARPGPRDLAVVTTLEHHSNLLPWRRAAGADNVMYVPAREDGTLDLSALAALLKAHGRRVRVVAATAASNVTGVVPDLRAIARAAHEYGAVLAVDAAQAAPHIPLDMHPAGDRAGSIDALALSGHKLFAPGAPGVLIARKSLLDGAPGADAGGGTVVSVTLEGELLRPELHAREEAGTPNVPGTIGLGVAARILSAIGMDLIEQRDATLTAYCLRELRRLPFAKVYGPTDPSVRRVGTVAFNLTSLPHGLVAAALSDFFGIAVRNECFCAQPYVREQLRRSPETPFGCAGGPPARPGMVRASFGPWNGPEDIDRLTDALRRIHANAATLCASYEPDAGGVWRSASQVAPASCFSLDGAARGYIERALGKPAAGAPFWGEDPLRRR
jgi:cysteine desulfurase/selenocysteine lyase